MKRLARWLYVELVTHVADRKPDFIVGAGNTAGAYLHRWYLTPWRHWQGRLDQRARGMPTRWNRMVAALAWLLPNAYLHLFLRDDDDSALHDHPWPSLSLMLGGAYVEHTIAAGGIHRRELVRAGTLRYRPANFAHRIELLPMVNFSGASHHTLPCWTLFITGPRIRRWGFHCPEQGWIPFERFTKPGATGELGAGCEG